MCNPVDPSRCFKRKQHTVVVLMTILVIYDTHLYKLAVKLYALRSVLLYSSSSTVLEITACPGAHCPELREPYIGERTLSV